MIRAIIFDCFGVLAEDGWAPFKRTYLAGKPKLQEKVSKLGKEVDQGDRSYEEMIKQTAKEVGIEEEVVREAVECKVPNEELFAYIEQELKPKYKIGILSNASYDVINSLFTPRQSAVFDATALSHEVGLVKPHPSMYQIICERLEVRPEEAILVDDKEGHAEGARAASMQAIVYTTTEQLKVDLAKLLQ